jgi:ureidoglycolate hydrolase
MTCPIQPQADAYQIKLLDLSPEAFAPFGQVITPRRSMGQWIVPDHNPGTSPDEAQLTLHEGIPRLWIMHLKGIGPHFADVARHMHVTQCLGSLGGTEWFFAVAAPTPPGVDPAVADIVGFRIPGDRIVKLHIGTWHAGPHFLVPEALFLNLENMNTRREDFDAVHLPVPCTYAFSPGE